MSDISEAKAEPKPDKKEERNPPRGAVSKIGDITLGDDGVVESHVEGSGASGEMGDVNGLNQLNLRQEIIGDNSQGKVGNIRVGHRFTFKQIVHSQHLVLTKVINEVLGKEVQISAEQLNQLILSVPKLREQLDRLAHRMEHVEQLLDVDEATQAERNEIFQNLDLHTYYTILLHIGWYFASAQTLSTGRVAIAGDLMDDVMDVVGATVSSVPILGLAAGPIELAKKGIKSFKESLQKEEDKQLAGFIPDLSDVGRVTERFARKATLAKAPLLKNNIEVAKEAKDSRSMTSALARWWKMANGERVPTSVEEVAFVDVEKIVEAIKTQKIAPPKSNPDKDAGIKETVEIMLGALQLGSPVLSSVKSGDVKPSRPPSPGVLAAEDKGGAQPPSAAALTRSSSSSLFAKSGDQKTPVYVHPAPSVQAAAKAGNPQPPAQHNAAAPAEESMEDCLARECCSMS